MTHTVLTTMDLPEKGSMQAIKGDTLQLADGSQFVYHTELGWCYGNVIGITDPVTGGSAFSGDVSLPTVMTHKIALGIVGQSVEMGSSAQQDANGVWQLVVANAPSQGIFEPTKLSPAGFGSPFTAVAEKLAADGIKVELHNGAVGGSSAYLDWTGYVAMGGRQNSYAYRGKRTSLGVGDPGHRGELIYVNGATWEATTGNRHLAFWGDAQNPVTVAGATFYADPGYVVKETNLATASTAPTFPGSPVVGNSVTDGGIVWTCIAVGVLGIDANNVHVRRAGVDGWDPYYMCARLRNALMASKVLPKNRFVYFEHGQSDAGVATAIYTMALRMLGQWFGQPLGITPIFGLSIFNPWTQTKANWDLLETTLSGTGIDGAPNYETSPLTVALVSGGYHLATPGNPITNYGFYYGPSLYRAFGVSNNDLLQPASPHPTAKGMMDIAAVLAPTLSRIFRNRAT